ncbi:MAG: hypothetical protein ACQEQ4_08730 [Fibrobacterota bacterium]
MKRINAACLILTTLLTPLMAEDVMKITLFDSVSYENLTDIGTLVFEESAMITTGRYTLDEIEKIEFVDDKTADAGDN